MTKVCTWYGKIAGVNKIKSKGIPTSKANVLIQVTAVEPEGERCQAVIDYDPEAPEPYPDTVFEIIGVVDSDECLVIGGIKVPITKAIDTHLALKTRTLDTYVKNARAGHVRRTGPDGRIMHYFAGQALLSSWSIEVEPSWSLPEQEVRTEA